MYSERVEEIEMFSIETRKLNNVFKTRNTVLLAIVHNTAQHLPV